MNTKTAMTNDEKLAKTPTLQRDESHIGSLWEVPPFFVQSAISSLGLPVCQLCANVQSKAVFSYAMTVMDKICGWEGEEQ